MTENKSDPKNDNSDAQESVERVAKQLEAIETFITRRFDEISAEINATSQQVDMAEDGIVKRFSEILEVLTAISHSGANTPANAGVELDAVVDMTEDAANKILDSAGRISTMLQTDKDWDNADTRAKIIEAMTTEVDQIFMACSFQDLTSQRIRKTLDNIKMIKDRLGSALDKIGIKVELEPPENQEMLSTASSQDEIDELFG